MFPPNHPRANRILAKLQVKLRSKDFAHCHWTSASNFLMGSRSGSRSWPTHPQTFANNYGPIRASYYAIMFPGSVYEFLAARRAFREEEEEDREIQFWIQLKRNIWQSRQLDDKTFLRMFRMTRPDFVWLVDQLRAVLYQDEDDHDDPLSVETQVSVSLYYLGHGSSWSKLDDLFGLNDGAAESSFRFFAFAVRALNNLQSYVGVPADTDVAAWDEISQRFLKKGGIPGVVGVIDTMHVPIKMPKQWSRLYLNRRRWPSIVVQAVVDADGNFQDFDAVMLGSSRDQQVFRSSPIGALLDRGQTPVFPPGTFLLADRGFTDSKWIMRPYTNNDSESALNFNVIHAKIWKIVDLAFRVLRARFRVLMTKQDGSPLDATSAAYTCMILHNLRNGRGKHVYPRPGLKLIKRQIPSVCNAELERQIERDYRAGRAEILTRRDDLANSLIST